MIEVIIQEYLTTHLSVPVFTDHQPTMPEKYVIFEKTGSTKRNHLMSATLAFQSYAESKYQAALLNEELKSVVENMLELDVISKVQLNSDYDFTDTETKKYRYQAVFDIHHY